jgi:transcriptional regulator with XRE-family HTH domain
MAETIGSRIRAARTEYGMAQAELGRRVGISRQQMNSIEFDRQPPTAEQVAAIARILRVSGDYLLGLSDTEELDDGARLTPHLYAHWHVTYR